MLYTHKFTWDLHNNEVNYQQATDRDDSPNGSKNKTAWAMENAPDPEVTLRSGSSAVTSCCHILVTHLPHFTDISKVIYYMPT